MVFYCDIGRSFDMNNMYIIIYMGNYIEKLDNTFIYPPHPIPKPNQYNNKYYCQYGTFCFLSLRLWRLECKVDIFQTEYLEWGKPFARKIIV